MKKIAKFLSVLFVFAIITFLFSSFTPSQAPAPEGTPVEVEIIKDGWFLYITDCEGGMLLIECTSSTWQLKNGITHVRTTIYQLPEGHCMIPESSYKEGDKEYSWHYIPDGKIIVKQVIN